ncbi:MAG: hypothetical protein IJV81_04445 [Paludibacteraceae bacterium]|nr:hypothetical protein [Paludibacteraceae bacterium]MBQ9752060.1 hypothetical protein [Paludibacteraceae bacterium]MBR1996355.1 hypothetical protein [Paludibacteraceae bacterium]
MKINIILSALIALLCGCKSHQETIQANAIRVMYGPPAYFQQQDTQQQDTTSQEDTPNINASNGPITE